MTEKVNRGRVCDCKLPTSDYFSGSQCGCLHYFWYFSETTLRDEVWQQSAKSSVTQASSLMYKIKILILIFTRRSWDAVLHWHDNGSVFLRTSDGGNQCHYKKLIEPVGNNVAALVFHWLLIWHTFKSMNQSIYYLKCSLTIEMARHLYNGNIKTNL